MGDQGDGYGCGNGQETCTSQAVALQVINGEVDSNEDDQVDCDGRMLAKISVTGAIRLMPPQHVGTYMYCPSMSCNTYEDMFPASWLS